MYRTENERGSAFISFMARISLKDLQHATVAGLAGQYAVQCSPEGLVPGSDDLNDYTNTDGERRVSLAQ